MFKKIYLELVRIRKELCSIREILEQSSMPEEINNFIDEIIQG